MTATLALVLVWPLLADAQRSFTVRIRPGHPNFVSHPAHLLYQVRNLCPFTIWYASCSFSSDLVHTLSTRTQRVQACGASHARGVEGCHERACSTCRATSRA